ncbi:hypothetical protein DM860_012659 [Cuscuta australis]|uniref:CSC1/OSCA1-like 7TM region domain-containing protein n=1 Tax=Cuscuta australis TaxID=267555 RepID=A0A328DG37_9ASTE|nr:hypothetical protein DM860_012659 [Cuscuta australis]
MAGGQDIMLSASINLLSAIAFLVAFAILRLQPFNDRVYFPKWYLKGIRASPRSSGPLVRKFVNLDFRTYIRFLNWMPAALRMPQPELIDHAGLDSAVYIRIYLLGLKIFVPITILAFAVLVPVNWTGESLQNHKDLTYDGIDKLSISNIDSGSIRLWAHISMAYMFTFWTFYVLYKEYKIVSTLRLQFLASTNRSPDQFTVLVRNVPPDLDESVSEHVEHFFCVNHPDHYLIHQEEVEREKVLSDPKAIMPAAFVSFSSRWGAAVCAQTQQTSNPTVWLTEWAPEPRDVYWNNLSIPYVELNIRRLFMGVALFFLTFFFMIPIAFIQSLASIEGIEKVFPFLKKLIEMDIVKSFVQGFLPGIALKIFLIILPSILMAMSKIEGFTSLSSLERRSAGKYHLFLFVNVFLGSIITGAAFEQLQTFMNQSPTEIPRTVGVAIPIKATFFITYVMVDGWSGIAAEILRLTPLIMFHIKNSFLVKTERDREQAMDPGSITLATSEPRIQLYFLLGLVYSVATPVLLPFIVVFFAFAYLVFRHQIINVYDQKYESGAAFWPDVHFRIIIGMITSQILLMGLMNTKGISSSTPVILVLPVLTIWFHRVCKGRFESAFVKFPLQDAMVRDTLERATEPNLNLKMYLKDAYVHPVFKGGGEEAERGVAGGVTAADEEENSPLVSTKRSSHKGSKRESHASTSTAPPN